MQTEGMAHETCSILIVEGTADGDAGCFSSYRRSGGEPQHRLQMNMASGSVLLMQSAVTVLLKAAVLARAVYDSTAGTDAFCGMSVFLLISTQSISRQKQKCSIFNG